MKIGDKVVLKENGYYGTVHETLRSEKFKPGNTGVISELGCNSVDYYIELDCDTDNPKFPYYMHPNEFEVIE